MAQSALETSEGVGSVFEPDVLSASQFYGIDERGVVGAERKLMAALLSDGVEAYLSTVTTGGPETEQTREARNWVEISEPDYLFSFDSVCTCLGIDPQYLRLGLRRYSTVVLQGGLGQGDSADPKGGSGLRAWKRIRRPRR